MVDIKKVINPVIALGKPNAIEDKIIKKFKAMPEEKRHEAYKAERSKIRNKYLTQGLNIDKVDKYIGYTAKEERADVLEGVLSRPQKAITGAIYESQLQGTPIENRSLKQGGEILKAAYEGLQLKNTKDFYDISAQDLTTTKQKLRKLLKGKSRDTWGEPQKKVYDMFAKMDGGVINWDRPVGRNEMSKTRGFVAGLADILIDPAMWINPEKIIKPLAKITRLDKAAVKTGEAIGKTKLAQAVKKSALAGLESAKPVAEKIKQIKEGTVEAVKEQPIIKKIVNKIDQDAIARREDALKRLAETFEQGGERQKAIKGRLKETHATKAEIEALTATPERLAANEATKAAKLVEIENAKKEIADIKEQIGRSSNNAVETRKLHSRKNALQNKINMHNELEARSSEIESATKEIADNKAKIAEIEATKSADLKALNAKAKLKAENADRVAVQNQHKALVKRNEKLTKDVLRQKQLEKADLVDLNNEHKRIDEGINKITENVLNKHGDQLEEIGAAVRVNDNLQLIDKPTKIISSNMHLFPDSKELKRGVQRIEELKKERKQIIALKNKGMGYIPPSKSVVNIEAKIDEKAKLLEDTIAQRDALAKNLEENRDRYKQSHIDSQERKIKDLNSKISHWETQKDFDARMAERTPETTLETEYDIKQAEIDKKILADREKKLEVYNNKTNKLISEYNDLLGRHTELVDKNTYLYDTTNADEARHFEGLQKEQKDVETKLAELEADIEKRQAVKKANTKLQDEERQRIKDAAKAKADAIREQNRDIAKEVPVGSKGFRTQEEIEAAGKVGKEQTLEEAQTEVENIKIILAQRYESSKAARSETKSAIEQHPEVVKKRVAITKVEDDIKEIDNSIKYDTFYLMAVKQNNPAEYERLVAKLKNGEDIGQDILNTDVIKKLKKETGIEEADKYRRDLMSGKVIQTDDEIFRTLADFDKPSKQQLAWATNKRNLNSDKFNLLLNDVYGVDDIMDLSRGEIGYLKWLDEVADVNGKGELIYNGIDDLNYADSVNFNAVYEPSLIRDRFLRFTLGSPERVFERLGLKTVWQPFKKAMNDLGAFQDKVVPDLIKLKAKTDKIDGAGQDILIAFSYVPEGITEEWLVARIENLKSIVNLKNTIRPDTKNEKRIQMYKELDKQINDLIPSLVRQIREEQIKTITNPEVADLAQQIALKVDSLTILEIMKDPQKIRNIFMSNQIEGYKVERIADSYYLSGRAKNKVEATKMAKEFVKDNSGNIKEFEGLEELNKNIKEAQDLYSHQEKDFSKGSEAIKRLKLRIQEREARILDNPIIARDPKHSKFMDDLARDKRALANQLKIDSIRISNLNKNNVKIQAMIKERFKNKNIWQITSETLPRRMKSYFYSDANDKAMRVKKLLGPKSAGSTYIDAFTDNVMGGLAYPFKTQGATWRKVGALSNHIFLGALGFAVDSGLKNLLQGVNTLANHGGLYTGRGYRIFASGIYKKKIIKGILENAGVIGESSQVYELGVGKSDKMFGNMFGEDWKTKNKYLGKLGKAVDFAQKGMKYVGEQSMNMFFKRAENINRGTAYFTSLAESYGKTGANLAKSDNKLIQQINGWLQPERMATPIENIVDDAEKFFRQAHEVAIEDIRLTQYDYSKVDTPLGLQHPAGKLALQFYTYPLKTSEMIAYWAKHNPEKLARFVYLNELIRTKGNEVNVDMNNITATNLLHPSQSGILPITNDPTLGMQTYRFTPVPATTMSVIGMIDGMMTQGKWNPNDLVGKPAEHANNLKRSTPMFVGAGGRIGKKIADEYVTYKRGGSKYNQFGQLNIGEDQTMGDIIPRKIGSDEQLKNALGFYAPRSNTKAQLATTDKITNAQRRKITLYMYKWINSQAQDDVAYQKAKDIGDAHGFDVDSLSTEEITQKGDDIVKNRVNSLAIDGLEYGANNPGPDAITNYFIDLGIADLVRDTHIKSVLKQLYKNGENNQANYELYNKIVKQLDYEFGVGLALTDEEKRQARLGVK